MGALVCRDHGERYSLNDAIWRCENGGLLDIDFKSKFPRNKIKNRDATMWRYREAIPIQYDRNVVSLGEGYTPLIDVDIGGRKVLVKQDHLSPTGSYKDRGSSVLISKAKELGIKKIVEDSSGNAGSSMAAYCAVAGIDCDIYVPADTATAKLAQIQMYGANLHKIPGSREDTAAATMKAASKDYYASHSWNPFFFQGTKTWAFEVCEQLDWKAPNSVVVPVGNGTLLLGCYIGFRELLEAGVISRMPKIIGVQSEECAPLYKAFNEGLDDYAKINKKDTLAEGIAISEPVRGQQILEAVRESKGCIISVSDTEIKRALIGMCAKGFYIEPTSAATIAGVEKYLRQSDDSKVVSVFTGHGLKTTEKMLKILDK